MFGSSRSGRLGWFGHPNRRGWCPGCLDNQVHRGASRRTQPARPVWNAHGASLCG